MEELDDLKKKRDEISAKINKLVGVKERRLKKEAQKFVGKCYKFYNSMSGGDKFMTYLKVTKVLSVWFVGETMTVNIEGVEVNDHKDIYSINREITHLSMWLDNPISTKQFDKVYKKVLGKLT